MMECKRCLLSEIDPEAEYKSIQELISLLDPEQRTETTIYSMRLLWCKRCEFLNCGTCGRCGCYVEWRAATRTRHCPDDIW